MLARPTSAATARRPSLTPVAEGVALAGREIVLDRRARPAEDPALLLRAAAEAAERDVVLAPPDRGAAGPRVRAAAGPVAAGGAAGCWSGCSPRAAACSAPGRRSRRPARSLQILPEWERIRLLPHASAIHRFTVDRHVVETCIEASALIRQVAHAARRPSPSP